MAETKNFYIYGIDGVYNYGCDATVRAISKLLHKKYPMCEVYYKTPNYQFDNRTLSDCEDVIVSPLEYKTYKNFAITFLVKAIRHIKKRFKILSKPENLLSFNTDWINKCDSLIIIGGDIFNFLPNQEKPHKYYTNDRIWLSMVAKSKGAKVFIWGLSAGPFDSNPQAKSLIMNYFNTYVDKIIVRENSTYDYLKLNGVKNMVLCSDPAFCVRTITATDGLTVTTLGINLSPLANRYLGKTYKESEWINIWTDLIIRTMKKFSFQKVILLPHVVNEKTPDDDDLSYLKKIYENLKKKQIEVDIVATDPGFIGIKEKIIQCNLVIASRMHCAVNAITCGVPTIFLSYSKKSIGMCNHVYKDSFLVFDMRTLIDNSSDEKLKTIVSHLKDIKDYLSVRSLELCINAQSAVDYIE